MFKSLRWRLQAWQALILLLAVSGFGTALYLEISKARYDEIDAELLSAARTLDGALRAVPRPILQNGLRNFPPDDANRPPPGDRLPGENPPPRDLRPFQNPPPRNGPPGDDQGYGGERPPPRDEARSWLDVFRGLGPDRRPEDDRPDPNRGPDQGPRGGAPRPQPRPMPPEQVRRMLTLPPSFMERFTEDNQAPYFTISAANNEVLKSEAVPRDLPKAVSLPMRPDTDFRAQQRGRYREVMIEGPEHSQILVGRAIGREIAELGRLFWQLIVTGLAVFLTGLVGGWWLSGRAVRPIEKMSRTAASISATNLTQRIDVAEIDSELAALGNVLNAMFDRLQSAFDDQMRFTADASHELRTPLSVVLTHTELALNRSRTAEDYRETLETCLRAAQRMKLLVDDLLILARAHAGKLQLRSLPLDIKQALEDCAGLLEPLALERNLAVKVQGASALVKGDPDRLAQLITNLLSNAIFYNVDGGQVCLESRIEDHEAVVTVSDTGIGISPVDLPHVFDRFYRVDKARSRTTGGNGLGLAICKSIVEAHGGTIAVSSRRGGGTVVTVRLPAVTTNRLPTDTDQQSIILKRSS
jgi:two-component system, OmpR family, sensor kinase